MNFKEGSIQMTPFHGHDMLAQGKKQHRRLREPQTLEQAAKYEEIADVRLYYVWKNNQTDMNTDKAFCFKVYSHHALQLLCLPNATIWQHST